MARLLGTLLIIGLIALSNLFKDGDTPRRPRSYTEVEKLPDVQMKKLPSAAARTPVYIMKPGKPCKRFCTGSAFAIDREGHWLTARHVVTGCRRIEITDNAGRRIRVKQILHHPSADISLLATSASSFALPLNLSRLYQRQNGYHFGFPKGKPGEVHSVLLGHARSRRGGAGGAGEPVVAWAEVSRNPARKGSLGGLSGGAVLDAQGAVVGVTTAESPRRGRVISAAPQSVRQLLKTAGLGALTRAKAKSFAPIEPKTFAKVGQELRAGYSVVKVLCRA